MFSKKLTWCVSNHIKPLKLLDWQTRDSREAMLKTLDDISLCVTAHARPRRSRLGQLILELSLRIFFLRAVRGLPHERRHPITIDEFDKVIALRVRKAVWDHCKLRVFTN